MGEDSRTDTGSLQQGGDCIRRFSMSDELPDSAETRQERRDRRLRKKREQIPKHGRNLAQIYKDAILKRLKRK